MKGSRISYYNNWTMHNYHVGHRDDRKGHLKKIFMVRLYFPEGNWCYRKVRAQVEGNTVSDMGHTYHYSSTQYYVAFKFRGIEIELSLSELIEKGVEVYLENGRYYKESEL